MLCIPILPVTFIKSHGYAESLVETWTSAICKGHQWQSLISLPLFKTDLNKNMNAFHIEQFIGRQYFNRMGKSKITVLDCGTPRQTTERIPVTERYIIPYFLKSSLPLLWYINNINILFINGINFYSYAHCVLKSVLHSHSEAVGWKISIYNENDIHYQLVKWSWNLRLLIEHFCSLFIV